MGGTSALYDVRLCWLKEHKTPFTKLECEQMAARFNTGVRQRRRDYAWPRIPWEIMIRQTLCWMLTMEMLLDVLVRMCHWHDALGLRPQRHLSVTSGTGLLS